MHQTKLKVLRLVQYRLLWFLIKEIVINRSLMNKTLVFSDASLNQSSILRLRQPVSHMKETKTYKKILKKIKKENMCILHCWGVSGSGKSQIVRKLAERFPFTYNDKRSSSKNVIKWHIQCKDSRHDVNKELQKLTDELFKNAHIQNKETYQSIKDGLNDNVCDMLVETLLLCSFPVLIIVEDPDPDSYEEKQNIKLLQDFLRKLSRSSLEPEGKPTMHFYVTSNTGNPILIEDEANRMSIYKKEIVTGFDESEALEYLLSNDKPNKESATKIFQLFSGIPLGLQAAKGYCDDARINYSDYLHLLQDTEYEIIRDEEEAITKEFGDCAKHVFQAIVLPFIPTDEDYIACLHWKILLCLSYFNYDRIPRFAVEYCYSLLRESKVKKTNIMNKADVGKLITKLLDHDMCSETDKEEITFHKGVSIAFRLNRHSALYKPFSPLKKTIEIMCGLVSKDMRKTSHSNQMHQLRRHVQTLLNHIENEKEILRDENSTLLKALTSYLYETAAAIMLNESPALFLKLSGEFFEKALELVWDNLEQLEYKNKEFDPNLAKEIVSKSQEKGAMLPNSFTIEYASKLEMHFDDKEINFLKSKSSSMHSFKEVEKLIKSKESNKLLLEEMQKCKLFLPNEDYAHIFYAERVASILHSYSRLVLYADLNEARQYDKKCSWMNWLSKCIAVECRTACNVSLLVERLSQTGGLIPIVLKLKKTSVDDNVKALEFCKSSLSTKTENTEMYENGMLKKVFGPSELITRIVLLRSITRINARLLKSTDYEVDVVDADKNCNDLFEISVENWKEISSCTLCFIYCAKYYAARNNFEQAVKCYVKFFEIKSEESFKVRFNVLCWAVYNYARSVHYFDAQDLFRNATEKCELVLNRPEKMSEGLRGKLNSLCQRLKQ